MSAQQQDRDGQQPAGRLPADAAAMRVMLRPIGSPLPLGMFVLVASGMVLAGLQLGWFSPSESQTIALIMLGFAAPLQLLSSTLAFIGRDALVGTGFGIFTGVWLVFGADELSSPGGTSAVLGVLFLSCAALLAMLMSGGFAGGKTGVGAVNLAGSMRFLLSGLYELTATTELARAAGIVGLVFVVIAGYVGVATLLEDSMHHSVLPIGRRGLALAAFEEGIEDEMGELQQEAGIRNQL